MSLYCKSRRKFFLTRFEMHFPRLVQTMHAALLWLAIQSYSMHAHVVDWDHRYASVHPDGSLYVKISNGTALLPIRDAAPDTDIGPWCENVTKRDDKFHISSRTDMPPYNFPMENATCNDPPGCTRPGCSVYRETWYKSGVQAWIGCTIVFPWWYAAGEPGNRTMLPCPKFDNLTSTFWFRGVEYMNFMTDFGHPYGAEDCHHNILCSPSTHYFDETQDATLKWCQETPIGFYSPQCNNSLVPCDPPSNSDMRMQYFSTHGMGVPDGCQIRSTTPGLISTGFNVSEVLYSNIFSLGVSVKLDDSSAWIPPGDGIPSSVFGLLGGFMICINPTGMGKQVRLAFFHREWSVTEYSSFLYSEAVDWNASDEYADITIEGNGTVINFWLDASLIGSVRQTVSTASIGQLNLPGLPKNYTDGTLLHVGFFSIGLPTDFQNATASDHPYTTEMFTSMNVADVRASTELRFPYTTTTTSTTSTTTTIPTTTTSPITTVESPDSTVTDTHTSTTMSTTEPVTEPPVTENVVKQITPWATYTSRAGVLSSSVTTTPGIAADDDNSSVATALIIFSSLGIAVLLITFTCRYRCLGPLKIIRRGSRRVQPIGPKHQLENREEHGL